MELLLALRGADAWKVRRHALAQAGSRLAFLDHVGRRVPFYRDAGLSDFPLITRTQLACARARFVAAPAAYEPTVAAKTSGSSGLSLTVPYDLAAWYELNYVTYATVVDRIEGLRDTLVPDAPAVVLVSNERNRIRMRVVLTSLNNTLLVRELIGSSGTEDRAVVTALRHRPPPVLYGKSSYLLDLVRLDEMTRPNGARISPAAVLVSGENLFPDVRARLQAWFGAPVIDAYTSAEGGLIALGCAFDNGLHVQTARVALEVRRDDGTVGDTGAGELVLTNFTNWAIAIVRYLTGDRAVVEDRACACGHRGQTIVRLYGREPGTLDNGPARVGTDAIDQLFASYGLADFQLLEIGERRYVAKVVFGTARAGSARDELTSALTRALAAESVAICPVERITKPGGKMRRYVLRDDPANELAPRRRLADGPWHMVMLDGGNVENVCCAAFAGSAEQTARVGADGTLTLWRHDGGSAVQLKHDRIAPVRLVEASAARGLFAITGTDDKLRFWDARGPARTLDVRAGAVTAIALSDDGRLMATGDAAGSVHIIDVAEGRSADRIETGSAVRALALAADGESVAVGHANGSVTLWDAGTGIQLFTLMHRCPARSLHYAPNGKFLAVCDELERLRVWHLASASKHCAPPRAVAAAAFHPGGASLFSVDGAGRLATIDMASGAFRTLAVDGDRVTQLAASPRGDAVLALGRRPSGERVLRVYRR
ncbi:MAG TPA: hypothetical protein VIW69_15520 [Candidatus Elarobacter sp.]